MRRLPQYQVPIPLTIVGMGCSVREAEVAPYFGGTGGGGKGCPVGVPSFDLTRLYADRAAPRTAASDWHDRLPGPDPHPAELRVARPRVAAVLLPQPRELVRLDRLARLGHVHPEHLGRVQPEDLVLDLPGQLGVLV